MNLSDVMQALSTLGLREVFYFTITAIVVLWFIHKLFD